MWVYTNLILLIYLLNGVGGIEDQSFYNLVKDLAKWQISHPENNSISDFTKTSLQGSKYNFKASINTTGNVNNSIFTIQGKDKVPKWSFSTGLFANKAQEMGYQDCREIAKYKKRPITIIETEPEVEEQKPTKKPKKSKKLKSKPNAPPQWLLESSSSEEESDAEGKEVNLSGSESDEDSDSSDNEGKLWFLGLSILDMADESKRTSYNEDALVTKVGQNYPGLYYNHRTSLGDDRGRFRSFRNHSIYAKREYAEDDYMIEVEVFQKDEDEFNDKFEAWQVKSNMGTSDNVKLKVANTSSSSISFNQSSKVYILSESKASRLWCIFGLYCF